MEIWLTSEDLGAYGHDIGVTLPELLWQLVDVVPKGCMLRLGMTNPPYIMEHLEVRSLVSYVDLGHVRSVMPEDTSLHHTHAHTWMDTCIYSPPQEMAGILSHPRVYSFIHLPVQCGSDKVLADMKRDYTVADFRHVVDFLRDRYVHTPTLAVLVAVNECCVATGDRIMNGW